MTVNANINPLFNSDAAGAAPSLVMPPHEAIHSFVKAYQGLTQHFAGLPEFKEIPELQSFVTNPSHFEGLKSQMLQNKGYQQWTAAMPVTLPEGIASDTMEAHAHILNHTAAGIQNLVSEFKTLPSTEQLQLLSDFQLNVPAGQFQPELYAAKMQQLGIPVDSVEQHIQPVNRLYHAIQSLAVNPALLKGRTRAQHQETTSAKDEEQHHPSTIQKALKKYLNHLLGFATGKDDQVTEYYAEALLRDYPENFTKHSQEHYMHVFVQARQHFDSLDDQMKCDVLTAAIMAQAEKHNVKVGIQRAAEEIPNLRPEALVAMMDLLISVPQQGLERKLEQIHAARSGMQTHTQIEANAGLRFN